MLMVIMVMMFGNTNAFVVYTSRASLSVLARCPVGEKNKTIFVYSTTAYKNTDSARTYEPLILAEAGVLSSYGNPVNDSLYGF